jgi:hypothetical protein
MLASSSVASILNMCYRTRRARNLKGIKIMSRYEPRSEKDEFNDFLKELIRVGFLEGKALGITKFVIDQGCDKLTKRQEYVFQNEVIDRFVHETCEVCGEKIPWYQMYSAIESGRCVDHNPELKSEEQTSIAD